MRPPEFTGGNIMKMKKFTKKSKISFNEAAGIHRRKRING